MDAAQESSEVSHDRQDRPMKELKTALEEKQAE